MNKKTAEARIEKFMPGGIPRYLHCYDNGDRPDATYDRYTIVFTGRYRHKTGGDFIHLGSSEHPFHPQGFGQHGSSQTQIDSPTYGHLGKKIKFTDLPPDVQKFALGDYKDLWGLNFGT